MKRIEEVLNNENVRYDYHENEDGTYYGLVEFWTDTAGQDIPTEIEFDGTAEDFVKKFCEVAEGYDVDDEVEVFVPMRGERGIPCRVMDIVKDCQEAKDTLMKIAGKLQKAIKSN